MPNGNPNFDDEELPKYEAYFQSIAAALETFAEKHGLLVEKYYHEASDWSLRFTHPLGGQATLDVGIMDEQHVTVSSAWWLDDYEAATRSLRWGERKEVPKTIDAVISQLEISFAEVLDWKPGEWTEVARGYEEIWGRFTADQFKAITPKWPLPKK